MGFYYVEALTPYHHKKLIEDAERSFREVSVGENRIRAYRDKRVIWREERTVIVYISKKLKAGQLRGIYQALTKNLNEMEDKLGFRILMTNRHDWSTEEIIKTYWGQSDIEDAFKNLKNPYHLTLKLQFHWTDQKIIVHYFICVLGFLLITIVWRQVKIKIGYKGCIDTLLDILNNLRLATLLEESTTRGRVKAEYKLEEMSEEENMIMEALEIMKLHINRPKLNGVGVYS